MAITGDFEGGAVEKARFDSKDEIRFSIPSDPEGDERLWFYFRVTSPFPTRPWFVLENERAAHQGNWDVVRPVFSADGSSWVRAQEVGHERSLLARLLGREPVFRFRSPLISKSLWVAYSYPYTTRELHRFLKAIESDDRVRLLTLGRSEQQRAIPRVSIEAPGVASSASREQVWIVCREHPGETPASFVLEGLVTSLLEQPAGQRLLSTYGFHIVPMLNLDGVKGGHYYRNRKGIDLAQDWGSFESAEVRSLFEAMRPGLESHRVRLVLNLHSANHPRGHFFLETPEQRLPNALRDMQDRLLRTSDGVHPQLQVTTTVKLWDDPAIAGNYLNARYGVYCLYCESNYSVGADGTVVTPETLRSLGAALVRVLADVLVESR